MKTWAPCLRNVWVYAQTCMPPLRAQQHPGLCGSGWLLILLAHTLPAWCCLAVQENHISEDLCRFLPRDDPKAPERPAEEAFRLRM